MRVRVTGVAGKAQAVSVNHYEITWESPVIVEIFASRFIYKCHRNYLHIPIASRSRHLSVEVPMLLGGGNNWLINQRVTKNL